MATLSSVHLPFFAAGGDLDRITEGRGGERVGVRDRGPGEAPNATFGRTSMGGGIPPPPLKGSTTLCSAMQWGGAEWHRWVKFHTRGGVENFSVYSDWTA